MIVGAALMGLSSYLPTYVNQLLVAIPGISPQVVIGLPIMLFMLIVALGQPYLGAWSERVGRRKAMLWGAVLATGGFTGTAFACCLFSLARRAAWSRTFSPFLGLSSPWHWKQ